MLTANNGTQTFNEQSSDNLRPNNSYTSQDIDGISNETDRLVKQRQQTTTKLHSIDGFNGIDWIFDSYVSLEVEYFNQCQWNYCSQLSEPATVRRVTTID